MTEISDNEVQFRWNVPWSNDDTTELTQRIRSDQSIGRVAQRMGRTYSAVRNKALELGLRRLPIWTDARTDELKRFHGQGFSQGQIAKKMGVTRNAIIGKLNRLGLKSKSTLVNGRSTGSNIEKTRSLIWGGPRHKNAPAPRFISEEITELPADQSPCAVTFADLAEHHCRWPLADAGMSCGDIKLDGCPYCVRHARTAYRPRPSRAEPVRGSFMLEDRRA